ncbi:MAG: exodeoxyribonuclease III [Terriglobia bacterium]
MPTQNAPIKITSWNVNGIRAIQKKGFLDWFENLAADIVCLQETKAHLEQLNEPLTKVPGYKSFWFSAEKKGYSGVATYTRTEPVSIQYGFGIPRFDNEGRVLVTEYPTFMLYNIYFPNGKRDQVRLDYKLDFYKAILSHWEQQRKRGKKLIICGDVNTAHKEIDLARPKENEKISGFLKIEREWIDTLLERGFVDVFRHFNREPHQYTWWDMLTRARERNVGWRIDYFFVTGDLMPRIKNAWISPEVMGSDHCPVGLEIVP